MTEELGLLAYLGGSHLPAADPGLPIKTHNLCLILQLGLIQKENKDKDKAGLMKENPPCA